MSRSLNHGAFARKLVSARPDPSSVVIYRGWSPDLDNVLSALSAARIAARCDEFIVRVEAFEVVVSEVSVSRTDQVAALDTIAAVEERNAR
jgi:hypothetical protein